MFWCGDPTRAEHENETQPQGVEDDGRHDHTPCAALSEPGSFAGLLCFTATLVRVDAGRSCCLTTVYYVGITEGVLKALPHSFRNRRRRPPSSWSTPLHTITFCRSVLLRFGHAPWICCRESPWQLDQSYSHRFTALTEPEPHLRTSQVLPAFIIKKSRD